MPATNTPQYNFSQTFSLPPSICRRSQGNIQPLTSRAASCWVAPLASVSAGVAAMATAAADGAAPAPVAATVAVAPSAVLLLLLLAAASGCGRRAGNLALRAASAMSSGSSVA